MECSVLKKPTKRIILRFLLALLHQLDTNLRSFDPTISSNRQARLESVGTLCVQLCRGTRRLWGCLRAAGSRGWETPGGIYPVLLLESAQGAPREPRAGDRSSGMRSGALGSRSSFRAPAVPPARLYLGTAALFPGGFELSVCAQPRPDLAVLQELHTAHAGICPFSSGRAGLQSCSPPVPLECCSLSPPGIPECWPPPPSPGSSLSTRSSCL